MQKGILITSILSLLLLWQCTEKTVNENIVVIKGGTIIRANWDGSAADDIENGFIIVQNGLIDRIGAWNDTVQLPENAKIVDASGKFIVAGLIDGFAVINNQAYANAFLLSGVTSIIGVESARRGELFETANPSPEIFGLGEVGDTIQNEQEITDDFTHSAADKQRVMLLMYKLTPELLQHSIDLAAKHEQATIGELGFTSYQEAIEMGVQAFVHTTRYSLDIASQEMAHAVAKQPFSNKMNSPKWKYYQFLYTLNVEDSAVIQHAKNLGAGNAYLIPTLSLLYLDFPEHNNPWDEPVADLIDAELVNNPANKQTGNHDYDEEVQNNYTRMALKEIELEQKYYQHGAKYLTGSGCDVWGTMPGISLHTELELLQRIGLSNRQLIAAASSNFQEAFGWKKGKLQAGFDADILILKANPLENIENLKLPESIFLKGKQIDLESLKKTENE